jgi:hypothetical protein
MLTPRGMLTLVPGKRWCQKKIPGVTKAVLGKLGWERRLGPRGLERKLWQLGRGVWGREASESCPRQVGLGKLSWDKSYSLGRGGRKLS